MIRPPIETLLARIPNKYLLVMVAARRARELRSGQLPLVDVDSQNPVTIALEEIAAGRVEPEPAR
ncbi:MAG: DNA-directed RNA polymerase subunit omega [Armatimonadota bacterium]|nr:DNA-directed RNA polymerase subunit omega [Armatimonadota bacterium]MDR5697357.1 DNA-directed RNA polymerase subunit omega [Armatimonadota bacterium]